MNKTKSFAILIVCYKRLDGIKRLVKSLEAVDYDGRSDITLVFSIDQSDDDSVVTFASSYEWSNGPKRVITRDKHLGLKQHILLCGDLTEDYDILVVLEDDILVSNSMYKFAYNAAVYYWNEDRVAGISLFSFQKNWLKWYLRFEPQKTSYDAYFMKIAQSWGQVWTAPKWRPFKEWLSENNNFLNDGSVPDDLLTWGNSSWLKYHDKYCMVNNKYFVYPYLSLSTNFSDAGEHSKGTINDHQVELQYDKTTFVFPEFNANAVIYDEYMDRELIGGCLGIQDEDLTVDFWGTKRKAQYKRYVLSTCRLDYRVVSSYSLSLRPIELSVIIGLPGEGIWLYDTSVRVNQQWGLKRNQDDLNLYSLRTHDFRVLISSGFRLLALRIKEKFGK